MTTLTDLVSGSEIKTNVAFAVALFCCFLGFMVAVVMYAYYGFHLQKAMDPSTQTLTYVFVGQGFGGLVAALFKGGVV